MMNENELETHLSRVLAFIYTGDFIIEDFPTYPTIESLLDIEPWTDFVYSVTGDGDLSEIVRELYSETVPGVTPNALKALG